MGLRTRFPLDLLATLLFPLSLVVASTCSSVLFRAFQWLHHLTPQAWLVILCAAFATALLGTFLLFWAKLPQHRAGILFRFGCRQLPPIHQRLYRAVIWVIIPSIMVLSALLLSANCFQ